MSVREDGAPLLLAFNPAGASIPVCSRFHLLRVNGEEVWNRQLY